MRHKPFALFMLLCLFSPFVAFAQGEKKQEEAKVDFATLLKNWKNREKELTEAKGNENLIPYEKTIIERWLNETNDVLSAFSQISNMKDKDNVIKAYLQARSPYLQLTELEYRRAIDIKKLAIKIMPLKDSDLWQEANQLPALSNRLFLLSQELLRVKAQYDAQMQRVVGKTTRQTKQMNRLNAAETALEKLKKENPELYKKITSEKK